MLALKEFFSKIKKNKNESSDQNCLDGDKTLSFILAAKLDRPGAMSKCYKFKLEKELLHKAKKATMEYNQESSSKQDWNLIPLVYFLFFCNICLSLFIVYCLDVFFEIDVDRK